MQKQTWNFQSNIIRGMDDFFDLFDNVIKKVI